MDKWDKRFMELAETISNWSSCFKDDRNIGAVIVRNKRILTTGYNGAPAGIKSCKDKGECLRQKLGVPSGKQHELCYAIHAEQNAIIQAALHGVSIRDAVLYCTHHPCSLCARMLVNAGITRIVLAEDYPDPMAGELFAEAGIPVDVGDEGISRDRAGSGEKGI